MGTTTWKCAHEPEPTLVTGPLNWDFALERALLPAARGGLGPWSVVMAVGVGGLGRVFPVGVGAYPRWSNSTTR